MSHRTLNPMMSSVIICPVVRLDEGRRKDRTVSLCIAIGIHAVIFLVGGLLFVRPPQFAVQQGESSIEVDLVAAPEPPAQAAAEAVPLKDETEAAGPQPVKQVQEPPQPQPQSLQSTGGATTVAKPDYLRNPAPVYPESARRQGQQGRVLLSVGVDRFGKPTAVDIKQGSGVPVLDRAAVRAVWKWKFKPAYAGSLAVDSQVEVPIRFRLES